MMAIGSFGAWRGTRERALAAVLVLSVAACGGTNRPREEDAAPASSSPISTATTAPPTSANVGGGLIVTTGCLSDCKPYFDAPLATPMQGAARPMSDISVDVETVFSPTCRRR